MENEPMQFINGLIVKKPEGKAAEFITAKLSLKRLDLIEWLQSQPDDWINADILTSKKTGKLYCKINTWKPSAYNQNNRPSQPAQTDSQDDAPDIESGEFPF